MANDAVQFGAALLSRVDDQVQFTRRLEDLGFDSAWVGDHVLMPYGGTEGYTYLAAMAAATSRITIGSRVIVLPLRHPLMNAKMITQVDRISGGRVIYGVGIGGDYPPEFENLNIPRNERGRRGNENLEVMTRLFTEDNVTFEGRYYQVRDLSLNPKPLQQPHPPIWMGGRAEEAVDRAARYADGWFPNLNTVDGLRERLRMVRERAEGYGRDLDGFQVGIVTTTTIGEDHDTAHAEAAARGGPPGTRSSTDWDAMVDRYEAHGNASDIIAFCERYIEAGATHFVFNMTAAGERLDHDLQLLISDVAPYFRGKD
ncbi:MAG: LLM class flavin-dependent oxidoreductase [Dehalococcoidia bacterium]